jgi:hypothetical protein
MSGILQGVVASIGGVIKDAYFNLVTLLLPGNGTNGAQNNTFLDSSTNNFTITRNGNTTQGTFSPFSQTGWGNFFDGSSYLTLASNAAFDFGTGDFTVEGWFYLTSSAGGQALYSLGVYNTNGILYRTDYFYIGGFTYTPSLPINQWFHSAVTRSGTSLNVFVNGVSVASGTNSTSVSSASGLFIGTSAHFPATEELQNAYVSNFRLLKGTALYTSNFTPSTAPLTAITNTSLLTCQSNRFRDASTNNFTLTPSGTPSVQAFSPFAPTDAYSAGANGGSGYFDGSGDFLTTSGTNSAWALGTGDFQISFWLYPQSVSGFRDIFTQQNIGGTPQIFLVNNALRYNNAGIAAILDATTSIKVNEWVYCVLSRVSGTTRWFINGAAAGSVSDSNNWSNTNGWYVSTNAQPYQGYIADVRLVKGSGVTSSTVPTAPDTAITNTQFLVGFTNAGITDATAKNVLETVGNAQISTAQSKFGGSSMLFDGNGDYLTSNSATPDLYAFGSGDFTIECWIYLNTTAGLQIIYDGRPSTAQTTQPTLFLNSGIIAYYTNGANRIIGSTLSSATWYHIALARSGTSTKLFVDGTQAGSTYTDSTVYTNTSGRPWIGQDSFSSGANFFNGYIDDLRVTRGYARYTANFTPPASAFPLQ